MSIDENCERDWSIFQDLQMIRQPKTYRQRDDPFELPDNLFFTRYRFDKVTAKFVVDLIDLENSGTNRGLLVSKSLQVLIVLRFFGRNAHQEDIADLHGISQPSVSNIIVRIAEKLALRLPDFIKLPSRQKIPEVKRRFYNIASFPCVIGAIDCKHVRIKSPAQYVGPAMAGSFLNRKGYYSLNVQIVCDAAFNITDIVARSRGSRHDARIWNECRLKNILESAVNIHKGVILGDAAYPNSNILLTPFRQPQNVIEENYNKSHIATRTKIECLNGLIKSKFRVIFQRLRVKLNTAKAIVIAVAILHNIAKERNISFLEPEEPTTPSAMRHGGDNIETSTDQNITGLAFRRAFAITHFSN